MSYIFQFTTGNLTVDYQAKITAVPQNILLIISDWSEFTFKNHEAYQILASLSHYQARCRQPIEHASILKELAKRYQSMDKESQQAFSVSIHSVSD